MDALLDVFEGLRVTLHGLAVNLFDLDNNFVDTNGKSWIKADKATLASLQSGSSDKLGTGEKWELSTAAFKQLANVVYMAVVAMDSDLETKPADMLQARQVLNCMLCLHLAETAPNFFQSPETWGMDPQQAELFFGRDVLEGGISIHRRSKYNGTVPTGNFEGRLRFLVGEKSKQRVYADLGPQAVDLAKAFLAGESNTVKVPIKRLFLSHKGDDAFPVSVTLPFQQK